LAATPHRSSGSCALMLAAVAAASPGTTWVRPTNASPRSDVRMSSKYNSPAILATVRGDASSIRSIIAPPAEDKDKSRGQNAKGRLRPPRSGALLISCSWCGLPSKLPDDVRLATDVGETTRPCGRFRTIVPLATNTLNPDPRFPRASGPSARRRHNPLRNTLVPVKRVLEAARIPGPTVLIAPIRLPLTDGRL
jgi:hypothetical protein